MSAKQRITAVIDDDTELIARAIRRDDRAVRAIVRRYNQRLYRLARSVVGDGSEAEDVVQQAYVHAFTRLATFRGEARFSTWLSRIVLNEALLRLRGRRRMPRTAPVEEAEIGAQVIRFPNGAGPADPERAVAQRQIQALLERAIDNLPRPFRVVLMARLVEGMSVEETAELLDLRAETVKTRLHRARLLVKGELEKQLGPALTRAFPFDGWSCRRMADAVVAQLRRLV